MFQLQNGGYHTIPHEHHGEHDHEKILGSGKAKGSYEAFHFGFVDNSGSKYGAL